jgi:hypothetical protein
MTDFSVKTEIKGLKKTGGEARPAGWGPIPSGEWPD